MLNLNIKIVPESHFEKEDGLPFGCLKGNNFVIPYGEIIIPDGCTLEENFPFCSDLLKQIYEDTQEWFDKKFPNCCDHHKNLLQAEWFDKNDYKDLPLKMVTQLEYTLYHILQNIDKRDWYKEITPYIYHVFSSFGQLPEGYGSPVGWHIYTQTLINNIRAIEKIPNDKKEKLIQYVDKLGVIRGDDSKNDDFNISLLYQTYQKWLSTFPFDHPYFQKAKEHYIKILPLVDGEPKFEKYKGYTYKTLSKNKLVEILVNLTQSLINQVDSVNLLKEGKITEPEKHKIDTINLNHQTKQRNLSENFEGDENKYKAITEQWLQNEADYFKDILPCLPVSPTITNTPQKREAPAIRPHIIAEYVEPFYNILKENFDPQEHDSLKTLLETGQDAPQPLVFKGEGNKLADAFKQMINANLMVGGQKKVKEDWIKRNFQYIQKGDVKQYKNKYLNDIISTNKDKCSSAILDVKMNNGQYRIERR